MIAALSDGTPDLALPRPLRIDFAAPSSGALIMHQVCSTGIGGVAMSCFGEVYLIGVAAN